MKSVSDSERREIDKRERELESLRFKLDRASRALENHPHEWTFVLWVEGLKKAVATAEERLRAARIERETER